MTPTPTEPGTYVLVIDRAVFRQVPGEDLDAVHAAMENGLASVTFRANSQTIQAHIQGASIGWAPERHPSPHGRALGGQAARSSSKPLPGHSSEATVP